MASLVMAGAVTLALPGSVSAATWQVTPAQAEVVPDSATDAWGLLMNFPYDGRPDFTDAVHLSGTTWNRLTVPGLPGDTSAAVAGDSPTDAWAVWGTSMVHYDGSSWTTYTVPVAPGSVAPYLNSVAIVSPTDVWAAGSNGNPNTGLPLMHWNGMKWSQVTAPVPAGYTYAGVGSDSLSVSGGDLWVLAVSPGPNGASETFAARWDGTNWSLTPLPATAQQDTQVTNISAASATDVWVAGSDSTGTFVMHYNGSAWSTFRMPATAGQSDIVNWIAARGGEAWAVGTSQDFGSYAHAAAWHWDGSTWSSAGIPVTSDGSIARTVSYVPGSNTVWIEAEDPSVSSGLVIAAGG